MTPREAKTFSQEKILRSTSPAVLIFLLMYVLTQAPDNFYHGLMILFMAITSIHFYIILLFLLVLTYFFGGRAGKEIIIEKKNFVMISFKYTAMIIFPLNIYLGIIGRTNGILGAERNLRIPLPTYSLVVLAYAGLNFITLFAVWLLATYKMNNKIKL